MNPAQKKTKLEHDNINNGGNEETEEHDNINNVDVEEEMEEHNNINNGDVEEEVEDHNNINNGNVDRFSSLPDNLLISILNLLPIKSAAATSVLSLRWRHLWTHITHLCFDRLCFDDYQKLVIIGGYILPQIISPFIHTFDVRISCNAILVRSSFLVPWITQICRRNPEVITIDLQEQPNAAKLFELPICLFTTQSLTVLQLAFNFELNFPDDGNSDEILINLPNLKDLNLRFCHFNRLLLRTLFKSCPLLECLILSTTSRIEEDHFVDIVAPNLKDLKIDIVAPHHDYKCVFSIDAPNLKRFELHDQLSYYHFVNNPRALQEAILILPDYDYGRGDYHSRIVPLFKGISCARYLTFNSNFLDIFPKDVALPTFDNLTNLRIDCEHWRADYHVLRCLLTNLKTLVVVNLVPIREGIRFLEQFLSNATVLEQLDVYSTDDVDCDGDAYAIVGMEYKFCIELFRLPRSSSNCLVNYFGSIFNASSNEFRNGKLVFEVTDHIDQLG